MKLSSMRSPIWWQWREMRTATRAAAIVFENCGECRGEEGLFWSFTVCETRVLILEPTAAETTLQVLLAVC
jgi:hypothetical protein